MVLEGQGLLVVSVVLNFAEHWHLQLAAHWEPFAGSYLEWLDLTFALGRFASGLWNPEAD